MTFSILLFAYRKPGTSPASFKEHYENTHLPLLKALAGETFPNSHTRRYIQRQEVPVDQTSDANYSATVLFGNQTDFEYDAVSEVIFDDEKAFQVFFGRMSEKEAAAKFAADEKLFLDGERMRVVVLGDCIVSTKA